MNVYRIYYTVNDEPCDYYVIASTAQRAVAHIRKNERGVVVVIEVAQVIKNWK